MSNVKIYAFCIGKKRCECPPTSRQACIYCLVYFHESSDASFHASSVAFVRCIILCIFLEHLFVHCTYVQCFVCCILHASLCRFLILMQLLMHFCSWILAVLGINLLHDCLISYLTSYKKEIHIYVSKFDF